MIDISLIIQIFVLLNPLSSFPFLIAAYEKKMNLKAVVLKAVITAFAIAVVMALVGPTLFSVFGITLDSFRIAGGVVLIMLGYRMVRPKEEEQKVTNIDSLITIIATPMLTGPGTISFITIKSLELGSPTVLSNLCFSFLLVGFIFFMFSQQVSKVNILSRILGLFLMAVAVEMISNGLEGIIRIAFL